MAHTFVDEWERVSALLSELDVLLGFAELSVNAPTPYVRPTMLDTNAGELVLIGALLSRLNPLQPALSTYLLLQI